MTSRAQRYLILPAVATLVVLADQVTKHLVRGRLAPGQSMTLAPWLTPVLQVTHVTNTGAAFGLFRGFSQVFIGVAVIVIVALIWYYLQLPRGQWLLHMALGLQLGGATGNLIDRLRFGGSVLDFVDLNFWPLRRWPVFNVADSSIVVGVALLTLTMLWEEWREGQTSRQLATAEDD
ncbi:MAG: signal peptidase II [Anaerolineae bacterium]